MENQELNFNKLFNEAKAKFEKYSENLQSRKLNILVAGGMGVGKYSLINAVFGGKILAQPEPFATNIAKYSLENAFSIYATKDLDMENFSQNKEQIDRFLQNDDQIHITWLCIHKEPQNGEKELYEMLKARAIPTIVIAKDTQDKNANGEKFSDIIKDSLRLGDEDFQNLRDYDDETIPQIELNELIAKTYNVLPKIQRLIFAKEQAIDEKIQEKAKKKLKKQIKKEAQKIVHFYSTAAGGVGLSPVPFSDIALILPTQIAMIIHISKIYDLDISADTAKKLIVAFGGVVGVGFGVRAGLGTVLKFIPIIGTVGGSVINAAVASGVTEVMGNAYIAYLDDNFNDVANSILDFGSEVLKKYFVIAKEKYEAIR